MSRQRTYPAKITAEWLKKRKACASAVRTFRETFPNGVGKITAITIKKARAARLDLAWFAALVTPYHGYGSETDCLLCQVYDLKPDKLAALLRSKQRAARQ